MTTIDPIIAKHIEQLIQAERDANAKQQEQLRAALDEANQERDELKAEISEHASRLEMHRKTFGALTVAIERLAVTCAEIPLLKRMIGTDINDLYLWIDALSQEIKATAPEGTPGENGPEDAVITC